MRLLPRSDSYTGRERQEGLHKWNSSEDDDRIEKEDNVNLNLNSDENFEIDTSTSIGK